MEYYLLFFTLLPPFFIALLLMLKYRRLNKLVISVIFATLIHEIFLVTFPVLHSIINNFINEKELCINVTAVELTKVMIGESLYVFLFCLVLFIGLNFKSGEKSNRNDNKIFYSVPEVKLFRILIIIGTLSYGMQLFYLGTNISNGFLLGLNTYLGGVLFSFTPIIASAIILTKKDSFKYYPKLSKLALICIASLTIIGIITATRGRIMWVASLIVMTAYVNSQKKIIIIALISLVISLPFFSFLGKYKQYAATVIISKGNASQLINTIFEERSAIFDLIDDKSFLDSFSERAQGPRNSVVLYNSYDTGNGADASVFLGSIFFPIPRAIWPNKLSPGSPDKYEENSAVFKVMKIGHNLPYMGPILASGHAYWEGGWLRVLVYGILSGLFWSILFNASQRLPPNIAVLVLISFSASLLIDGFLTALAPLYAYILVLWKWIIPLFVLYFLTRLVIVKNQ